MSKKIWLLIITILLLCACFMYILNDKNNTNIEINNNIQNSGDVLGGTDIFNGKEVDYSKINRKDEEKELVYTKEFNYIFQGADWQSIIPVINLNSEDAKKLNAQIEKKMSNYYAITYEVILNDNVLKLLISGDAEEGLEYDFYYIDIYTGQIVTNLENIEN